MKPKGQLRLLDLQKCRLGREELGLGVRDRGCLQRLRMSGGGGTDLSLGVRGRPGVGGGWSVQAGPGPGVGS